MALPSTSDQIFDLLIADSVLAAALGVYTFPDASTAPAMAGYGVNETSPAGTQIQGVEVVIAQEVELRPQLFVSGDGGRLVQTWRIYVTQYEGTATRKLQQVTERLIALLPGSYATPVNIPTGPANGIGVISQVVLTWKNPEPSMDFA